MSIEEKGKQMLFEKSKEYGDKKSSMDNKRVMILGKKLLPDIVFNMASLEGNPFTYPEVQTLLEGITVGGHKLSDEQQVLRIREGWEYVFDKAVKESINIDKELFNNINNIVAKDEALISGSFRTGQVRIGGTDYIPPKSEELDEIFDSELRIIFDRCNSKTELAFELFLWGALNQFYYDGNKRTSRLVSNLILLNSGQGFFNVKVKDRLEFNKLMVEFYDTKRVDNIIKFLYNKCLERY